MAILLPVLVKEKEVFGSPEINFLFLRVLSWRSNLRESGHWGYFEKLKVSGNKVKHSLINLSKLHFSLLEVTEYMANKICSVFFISIFHFTPNFGKIQLGLDIVDGCMV